MIKKEIIDHAWEFGFGGMIKEELEYLYDICQDKSVLELGSEIGQSAYVLASVAKNVVCVDIWDDTYEHLSHDEKQKNCYLNDQILYKDDIKNKTNIFKQFNNNCKEFIDSEKIKFIKGKTQDVEKIFEKETFDIILIDADHSYEGTLSDIYNYAPKLKKNGILLFHDYGDYWHGVKSTCDKAVNENTIIFVSVFKRLAVFKLKNKFL